MESLPTYGFEELCQLVDLPSRTVRYYIQTGLVDRPDGHNRGARYATRHVEQLLTIRKWQGAGLSLERIRELLRGDETGLPPMRPKAPGSVEVWSRLLLAPGVELQVEAAEAGLSPEQTRQFFRQAMALLETIRRAPTTTQGQQDE